MWAQTLRARGFAAVPLCHPRGAGASLRLCPPCHRLLLLVIFFGRVRVINMDMELCEDILGGNPSGSSSPTRFWGRAAECTGDLACPPTVPMRAPSERRPPLATLANGTAVASQGGAVTLSGANAKLICDPPGAFTDISLPCGGASIVGRSKRADYHIAHDHVRSCSDRRAYTLHCRLHLLLSPPPTFCIAQYRARRTSACLV